MRKSVAYLSIQQHLSRDCETMMNIVKENFDSFSKGVYVEPNSLFVRSIDSLTLKVIDFVIDENWNQIAFYNYKKKRSEH